MAAHPGCGRVFYIRAARVHSSVVPRDRCTLFHQFVFFALVTPTYIAVLNTQFFAASLNYAPVMLQHCVLGQTINERNT